MSGMTSKTRILNALTGKEVDRMPWSPFLAYFWEYQPKEIQEIGQIKYMQEIGADPLRRGSHEISRPIYKNCEVTEKIAGDKKIVRYETKHGSLELGYTYSPDGDTWFLIDHPVKEEEDYKLLQYIYENIELEERIKEFDQANYELGENGLYLPLVGVNHKTAFQTLLETWSGTEELSYALFDFPEVVEECLEVMREKNRLNAQIAAKSSAEGVLFFEDSSTTNISPDMFAKYTIPEINAWGDIMHKENKLLVHHACGHLKHIMEMIGESKIDVLESLSPPPTGNIELVDARKILPEHIAIIGGIEPVNLLDKTLEELEPYVEKIIRDMKGTRYVLANSDSCPPGVTEEKFRLISQLVRK